MACHRLVRRAFFKRLQTRGWDVSGGLAGVLERMVASRWPAGLPQHQLAARTPFSLISREAILQRLTHDEVRGLGVARGLVGIGG